MCRRFPTDSPTLTTASHESDAERVWRTEGFALFVKVQVKTPKIDQVFSFPLSFPRCHGHVTGGQSEASAVSKAMISALRV